MLDVGDSFALGVGQQTRWIRLEYTKFYSRNKVKVEKVDQEDQVRNISSYGNRRKVSP